MPPRKAEKRKNPGSSSATASTSNELSYKSRLILSNKEERTIRNIVISIMFSTGDSYIPLRDNENLVVDLLKNEMILLLEDIVELKSDRNSTISFSDLLSILRHQKGIISRFLAYLSNRIEMAKFMKPKSFSSKCRENIYGEELESDDEKNETEAVDEVDEFGQVEGEEGEYLNKRRKKYMAASAEEELLEMVRAEFEKLGLNTENYENFNDETFNSRQAALLRSIEDMSPADYSKFTSSRRVTFQKNSNPNSAILTDTGVQNKPKTRMKMVRPTNSFVSLLIWIGKPPLRGEAAEMLFAFVAKELISLLVGSALQEKNKEPESLFKDDPRGEFNTLQVRHYEEALRKNKDYRKYGRFFV